MSTSLGVPGDVRGPEVTAAVQAVFEACQARGIPIGATGGDLEQQLDQGFRFLAVGSDIGLTARTTENLARAREKSGR